MTWFSKYIIGASILGIIGIPVFIFELNDLSWQSNKESYWGIIALVAIVLAVFVEYKATQVRKR